MAKTPNYVLYITDDSSERFIDWREKMNGTEDSNMLIIDEALAQKADKNAVIDGGEF